MPIRRLAPTVLLLCLTTLTLSSCLARRRVIVRSGGKTSQPLLVANRNALLDGIARQYNAVRDFSATVDMVPALGSAEKSKITEYKDVRGFILFRKPDDIRIIGLYPVVRNKAFDMVSNGTDFKLYVPSRNRFIVGHNAIEKPSENKLENLRPQHFVDALMVRPVDPEKSRILVENLTDEDAAFYIIHEVQEVGSELHLNRTLWFNRLDLRLSRQLILDAEGNILTDARYAEWQVYDGVLFPKHIEINRPRDEYGVVLEVVKLDINQGVTNDKLVLEQPEGTTLQVVGKGTPPNPAPAPPSKGNSRKK